MAALSRRWQLAGLLLVTFVCMACNPITSMYFLMFSSQNNVDPAFRLASDDKHKDVKVVVLTSSSLELREEFLGSDRELAQLVARKLQDCAKENKENLNIASPSRVQRFKDDHPNWGIMDRREVGKCLEADYVIDLEIDSLSLYEPGSHNQIYRGRAGICVSVTDVHKPGEGPAFTKNYTCTYPRTHPVMIDDTNREQFRQAFLTRVATDLAWLFTSHPVEDDFPVD